jgi:hypothetical protein
MSGFLAGLGLAFLAPLIGARLLFLSRWRVGWVTYLCCVVTETALKKTGLSRLGVELIQAAVGLGLLALSGLGSSGLVTVLAAIACIEVTVRARDGRILREVFAARVRPASGGRGDGKRGTFTCPCPSVDPDLTFSLRGPFVERMPRYQLGHLWLGQELDLLLTVANHTRISTQTPVGLRVLSDGGITLETGRAGTISRLRPGEAREWRFRGKVTASMGSGALRLRIAWGQRSRELEIRHDGAGERPQRGLKVAHISRYAGGCRAAFAWRGDMDLYDEVTFQSIEGLEETLSLAARYRIPQTLFLSTRLTLDVEEGKSYAEHYGVDRGAARIPDFVRWVRENVELRHASPYPFRSTKRFLIELGNHGHLHFGTDAAAAPANGWKFQTKLGGGRYPWLGEETGSFAEQRDNALEAARRCEAAFGFRPRSWAMPDRTRDSETPRAMEAAGCEVLSDSDVRTIHNVLLQPPAHHPDGTRAVELTKRYPGDPLDVFHVAMNIFWFHRAHRLGIPVVFMCHQHMRAYKSRACATYTEYLLRYVLERFNGDLHVNTVFGVGKYWREVLSPATRTVKVRVEVDTIVVTNGSDEGFDDIPVDLETTDGRRFTRLVSLAAGAEVRLDAFA